MPKHAGHVHFEQQSSTPPLTMSTRGASVQTRISFQRTSHKRARTHTPTPRDPLEVIIVSDSDDEGPVLAGRKKTVRQREKTKAVPQAHVYDITSDEGDGDDGVTPKPDNTTFSVLRAKVHALELVNDKLVREACQTANENSRLKADNANLREEAEELRALAKKVEKPDKFIDVDSFEDHTACQVCTSPMWSPYILAECGHTFCESCLQDWFSTTLAQHLNVHPDYNVNQPISPALLATLRHLRTQQNNPQLWLRALQELLYTNPHSPQPTYTCPACRETVRTKPIECYALKAIVRTVANASGQTSPKKPAPRGRGPPQRQSPWDGFFPATIIP